MRIFIAGGLLTVLAAACAGPSASPIRSPTLSPAASVGEPTQSPTASRKVTAVIDGVEYTCTEILGAADAPCPDSMEETWARWSGGIDAYIGSPGVRLATEQMQPPLGINNKVAFGFVACQLADMRGSLDAAYAEYAETIREGPRDATDEVIEGLFDDALRYLCPGVADV